MAPPATMLSGPSSGAGVSLPGACAVWAASFSAAWPLTDILASGSSTAVVGIVFTVPFVLGLAFVGMLAGKALDGILGHGRPHPTRVSHPVALLVATALVAAGVWFGWPPAG